MSLNHYSVARAHDNGGHLMIIECQFREIRSVNTRKGRYIPANPTSAKKQEQGMKQDISSAANDSALGQDIAKEAQKVKDQWQKNKASNK